MSIPSQSQKASGLPRRRIVFIYKDFQTWFSHNFMTGAAASLVATLLILIICFRYASATPYRSVFISLGILAFLALLGWMCSVYWVGLMISRRLSGPLYRFEKTLEQVGQGNLGLEVRLRKDDRLQDFAETINQMSRGLRRRAEHMQTQAESIRQLAEELDVDPALQREIKRLAQEGKSLFSW